MAARGPVAPRRVRVLLLGHTAELGGAELSLLRLLSALDPGQIVAHVALFADGPLVTELSRLGVPVEVIPLGRLARASRDARLGRLVTGAPRLGSFGAALIAHVRRVRPDLVVSTTLKSHLAAAAVAPAAGVPLVWHLHDRISTDYLPGARVALLRALARHSPQAVIVNSAATGATVPGVRRLVVAPPGLAPDQRRAEPRASMPPGPPLVGLLGRISPTKGQREFVAAAARVHAARPDTRFVVVGAPLFDAVAYAERVTDDVRRLDLEGKVSLTGPVADPSATLDRLTLLVHASPVPEPFGQVVVEAMGRGVPVVATDAGGIPEILRPPGETPLGLLVPPGDVPALAEAILEVLDHPAQAQERAVRAWRSACTRLTVEHTARLVTQVWSDVAAANSGRWRRSVRMPWRPPPS